MIICMCGASYLFTCAYLSNVEGFLLSVSFYFFDLLRCSGFIMNNPSRSKCKIKGKYFKSTLLSALALAKVYNKIALLKAFYNPIFCTLLAFRYFSNFFIRAIRERHCFSALVVYALLVVSYEFLFIFFIYFDADT